MQKEINLIHPQESDVKFEVITFPDGEPHFKFKEEINHKETYSVISRICNPTDLFILMQVGRILNRHGVQYTLFISYLMSMRMDRVISFSEDFSLELVANAINSLKAEKVFISEPHSFRTISLIENSRAIHTAAAQAKIYIEGDDVICFPDTGAYDRYKGFFKDYQFIVLEKKRDLDTGKILSLEVKESSVAPNFKVKRVFVVDDLCDGGSTFALSATKLREEYPGAKLAISVCHMVNPKGISTLADTYDKIYFTNTYKDWEVNAENVVINTCI